MKKFKFNACFFVTCIALSFSAPTHAQTIDADNVLQRFPVAKNGDVLLLPVTIDNKQHLFMLDTGATCMMIDRDLLPAKPRRRDSAIDGSGQQLDVEVFDPPRAKIGKLDLSDSVTEVVAHDFRMFRKITGHEVVGLIGMDFLKKQVVHLDFDHGEVVFLKKADPHSFGEPITLSYSETRSPQVHLDLPGLGKTLFVFDTGYCSMDTGTVDEASGKILTGKGTFVVASTGLSETLSGTNRNLTIQGKEVGFENLKIVNPGFDVSGLNLLGLGFISRFNITLDFPNDRVFLNKSSHFDRLDKRDRSGLHLLRAENGAEVHSVDRGSAAQRAGIVAGDVVLMVGGSDAKKTSMYELRSALAEPEKTTEVTILHDGKQSRKSLTLK